MKKLEVNQMENLEGGRRFWGSETIGYGECHQSMYGAPGIKYPIVIDYIFWIATGPAHEDTTSGDYQTC